jgi:hypothetical protein
MESRIEEWNGRKQQERKSKRRGSVWSCREKERRRGMRGSVAAVRRGKEDEG